ncbi:hypothetical protein PspLS_04478 [Pyricularia sp. CBS 133598]|nr:hypothetical protein PspLS_04478 [Pyricularia sp. CBS 133598]
MALKCVHQGCGKTYVEGDEDGCNYHPGPPVFHEGQKGWKCCKPRVLTFEEFMSITPCTQGRHSTTDLPPKIEKKEAPADAPTPAAATAQPPAVPRVPVASATATPPAEAPAPPPESEDDDPALEIPDGKTCRRKTCGATYKKGAAREGEQCVHHPGVPIFHEGSKGYSCCKRRVLEFDQFMKIEGCATKGRHLFVGSGGKKKGAGANGAGDGEQLLESVRHDYYQTATTVTASFFLKKIDKDRAKVIFNAQSISLDLPTADTTRYRTEVPLFAAVDPAKSSYKILGTKLEVNLAKADVASWPVLRSDERHTGEILQVGRAGSVAR